MLILSPSCWETSRLHWWGRCAWRGAKLRTRTALAASSCITLGRRYVPVPVTSSYITLVHKYMTVPVASSYITLVHRYVQEPV